jgi:glycine cleavage system T protein
MPIRYPRGAVEEHRLTRRSAGLFDIDHMGRLLISGPGAGEKLSPLVSGRILDMREGEARYNLLLNESGGIRDDLFIYRLENDSWFVVVNAGNREADAAYLREGLAHPVVVEDVSGDTCMIALQGPRAVPLLDKLSGGAVSKTRRSSMITGAIGEFPVRIGRTGYTGEDGAELFYDADRAADLWELLLREAAAAGIEAGPVGLAARDSLRFEAGMPLHGHEISPSITPPEALLSWACDFEKDFIGREAILAKKAAGLTRRLATINVSGGVPREDYPVINEAGTEIGRCAAGMFCPTAGTYSANVLLPPEYTAPGTKLGILIRGTPKEAVVVKRPLYIPAYRKQKGGVIINTSC